MRERSTAARTARWAQVGAGSPGQAHLALQGHEGIKANGAVLLLAAVLRRGQLQQLGGGPRLCLRLAHTQLLQRELQLLQAAGTAEESSRDQSRAEARRQGWVSGEKVEVCGGRRHADAGCRTLGASLQQLLLAQALLTSLELLPSSAFPSQLPSPAS